MKIGTKTTKNPFETDTYLALKDLVKSVEYETQKYHYIIEHDYIPDFPIVTHSGQTYFLETKGNGRSWTPEVRRKMKVVKKTHPHLDIRFLFYTNAKFGGKRKDGTYQTQSEWAEKNGFPYAIRKVPEEWLI